VILGGFYQGKTNPIQSQICLAPRPALGDLKKQSQNRASAGNPKHEARNPKLYKRVWLKKQSQFALQQN